METFREESQRTWENELLRKLEAGEYLTRSDLKDARRIKRDRAKQESK